MEPADDQAREIAELRDRLSRLSQASLRINESLDFDTVLQGVLDSACSLTGARYGVITLLDESGQIEDFVTSGLTPEEHRRLTELPEGMMFFEYLSRITEPLRLSDFHSYTRALGLPEFRPPMAVSPVLTFLAAPIRHLGECVGAFYVGEKDVEFTPEDEETLVMFASQAALVIANARRHRDEQRARADLETLIDTSPVGVLVFDAKTGRLTSINREARRIVSGLHMPDGSAEGLLDMLTFRRGRRAGDLPGRVPPGPGAEHGRVGARRGDRHRGPRRRERHHPGQRHAHTLAGGRGRFSGRHRTGHDAAGGDGAAAGRVPGHGEPRAAHAADLHQRLSRHADGGGVRPGPRRDAPVLSHHRRAGRLHARPDRRPARRGAHRDGRAVGGPRACGGGDPGGRGQEQVPERRGQEQPPHRPLAGAAAGHGGRAPHHPGAEQPPHQRGLDLPRGVRHQGVRRAGGLPRGCLRHGRGQRDSRRAAAAPVSEVLPH